MDDVLLECPLCSFRVISSNSYWLTLHFEEEHTVDSGFKVTEASDIDSNATAPGASPDRASSRSPAAEEEEYVICPEKDCRETILLSDFNDHLELHGTEYSYSESAGPENELPKVREKPRSGSPAYSAETLRIAKKARESGNTAKAGLRRSVLSLRLFDHALKKRQLVKGLKTARLGVRATVQTGDFTDGVAAR